MATLPETFKQLFNTSLSNGEIITSIIIFIIVACVGWGAYLIFNRYFCKWAKKTTTNLDDQIIAAVKLIIIIMIVVFGIEGALQPLSILQPYHETLIQVFAVIEILLGAFAVTRVANIFADWYTSKKNLETKNSPHLLFLLKKIIQIVVFVVALLIILYVLDVNLTGAVVGLGVGGIAIAFALQSTLGDFFSAFSIYFDRPFEIGDFIIVGDQAGTVKAIGIRSTRLQLLQGEELVLPNQQLTSSNVRNFRKLKRRRIVLNIGVTYETSSEKLQKIPSIITDIINKMEIATLERVHFTEFADFSLKFLIIYYVESADWGEYLKVQEKINYAIKEEFEKEGIEMAYPTSTVFVKK